MSVVDSDCDLIVELIGGTDISFNLVKEAIKRKKVLSLQTKHLLQSTVMRY